MEHVQVIHLIGKETLGTLCEQPLEAYIYHLGYCLGAMTRLFCNKSQYNTQELYYLTYLRYLNINVTKENEGK